MIKNNNYNNNNNNNNNNLYLYIKGISLFNRSFGVYQFYPSINIYFIVLSWTFQSFHYFLSI